MLEKETINKNDLELINLIKSEAQRINKLFANMELISAGEANLPCKYINVHEILNHCKKIAQNSFGKNFHFVEDYDPSLPKIFGNYDLLVQIFLNLIKNSCEAQLTSGTVKLKTSYNSNKYMRFNTKDLPDILPLQIEIIDYGMEF